MKRASIPSFRLSSMLRAEAESVLEGGETLSGFIEQSLRLQIARRRTQREFIARGLASRDEARRTGEYFAADEVLDDLDSMLADKAAKITRA